jgi:hypothetical protein
MTGGGYAIGRWPAVRLDRRRALVSRSGLPTAVSIDAATVRRDHGGRRRWVPAAQRWRFEVDVYD